MASTVEGTFAVDGAELYTKTWTPDGPVRAKLIFIHGFSDHINRYNGFFLALSARGIQVFGFDQRGWGRTVRVPADRGLTGPTTQVLSDIAAFIRDKLPPSPSVTDNDGIVATTVEPPIFVMGNSMGGGEVATLASRPEYEDVVTRIRGWILEAPLIGFPPGEEPSFVKVFLGRLISRFAPKQQLVHALSAEYLSRDPQVVRSIREDPLNHETGTLEGLAGLLERTNHLASGRLKLSRNVDSLFVAHGTGDRTTSCDASREWFDAQNIKDAQFKAYKGAYHQLHSDLCKDEFYYDIGDWILRRSSGLSSPKLRPC
ncbi:alpha/beta hydrolase [Sodiomyces alkalinus F11]|uniref:Alpha/beta hydrolase n=1 Tax=Sodiomyces alkalinus (strain CBS 110278 / VKM F-3762 / F11) TaxID=1314773 RepID=A0A3N2PJV8_SODAK|nr:alpha/beta hydrolase [Sodiomyces alkalinus F11]ROT34805.1 alpha/beta hydrolase [Sodiomyces alkalinus F11]